MVRFVIFCCTASWILAAIPGSAASQYAQYYPPPSYYGRPPYQAVTPGPLRGAARSAAGRSPVRGDRGKCRARVSYRCRRGSCRRRRGLGSADRPGPLGGRARGPFRLARCRRRRPGRCGDVVLRLSGRQREDTRHRGKIDENVSKVMRQCAATRNITVPQACRETLRPRRALG
jgi:hypothetical protein